MVYDDFGLQTVFVMDPELIQQILLDDSDAFTKSPLYDNVLGRAGGKGLLIAEGDDWRWQRRIAAPLFRAEALYSYVPAFAAACEPVLARWRKRRRGLAAPDRQGYDRGGHAGAAGHQVTMLH